MAKVAAVRQVEPHNAVVRLQHSRVRLEVVAAARARVDPGWDVPRPVVTPDAMGGGEHLQSHVSEGRDQRSA